MNFSSSVSTTFTNRPQPPPPPPPPPPLPPPPPPSPSSSSSYGFLPPVQFDPPLPPPLLSHNPKQKLPHHFPHSHHHSSKPFFHLPSASTPPKPKPRKKPDPSFSSAASSSKTTTPPCTECGKRFSSWKALFGHMRCHPERQWRGINPPPHLRRSAATDRFTDEEYEVASSLLLLSRGPPKDVCVVPCAAERCDHKCNVCSRGFSTGQALGGHKRCHWEKGGGGGEEGGAECSSRNYNLDLNLPPPLDSNEGNASSVLDLRLGISTNDF